MREEKSYDRRVRRHMTDGLKNLTSRLKPTTEPMVGAGYPKGLLDFAVAKGADRATLLERAGLTADELEDLDNRVPLARYEAMMKAAAALTNEPALALQYGEAVRMQEISIVGLICEACETTPDVGVQLNRYGRLAFDDGSGKSSDVLRLTRNDDAFWIEAVSPIFDTQFVTESEIARLVWNTRLMFASHPDFVPFPVELHFKHPEPSYRAEYDRVFQAPITFNSRWNALKVDASFFSLRHPPVSRYVFGVLSERAAAMLKELERATSLRGRVERLLVPILHTGEINVERVAAELGMSRQTLYRKLKAEGASFETLLDELRHKMALHYLDGKKVSVNETAYLVGFSDPSAFSRAFRRWTGTSPRGRAKPSATVKE